MCTYFDICWFPNLLWLKDLGSFPILWFDLFGEELTLANSHEDL